MEAQDIKFDSSLAYIVSFKSLQITKKRPMLKK